MNQWVLEALTVCWFLAVGCSIGSFLNVVAYRMPLGMRLSSPKSHCPRCKTPLAMRDNIPVFGWLLLRGRCRYCQSWISRRYPIVEAITGGLFVLLLFVEPLSGGANLPLREPNRLRGIVWVVWQMDWELLGLFAYHAYLVGVLVAIGLMAIDGRRVPWTLVAWAVGIGTVCVAIWPTLHPVPFAYPKPEWWTVYDWRWSGRTWSVGFSAGGAMNAVFGAILGFSVGRLLAIGEATPDRRHDVACTLGIVGTFLGWHAAISVALAVAIVRLVGRSIVPAFARFAPTPLLMGVVVLGQIALWRTLGTFDWWPSHRGWPWLGTNAALTLVAAIAVITATSALTPRPDETSRSHDDEPVNVEPRDETADGD